MVKSPGLDALTSIVEQIKARLNAVKRCADLFDAKGSLIRPDIPESERLTYEQNERREAVADAWDEAANLLRQALGSQRSFWNELSESEEMAEARAGFQQPDPDEGTGTSQDAHEALGDGTA